MIQRLKALLVAAGLGLLLLPANAVAGGTAVHAPPTLSPADCGQGAEARVEGVPAVPLPPTVIGCLDLEEGTQAVLAADRWQNTPGRDAVCFYIAPVGRREVDGPCTSNRFSPGSVSNALTGARGVFPSQVRRVAGHLVVRGQTSTDINEVGLILGHREIPADLVQVEAPLARRLGAVGPFNYFAAAVPEDFDPCGGLIVRGTTASGRFSERTLSAAIGPQLRECALRAWSERASAFLAWIAETGRSMLSSPEPSFRFSPTQGPDGRKVGVAPAGRSSEGRPIRILRHGEVEAPAVLVFGCVHGDECAMRSVRPVTGCPLIGSRVVTVPNLNPDGFELGTRLNGRGVDLNRNFPSGWKPIGRRWGPQFSGPRPFSEPETRLAARIIREVQPEVTIWFHQHHEPRPLVRAWGGSVPAARSYARLAQLPFRRLPWLAGTAPNWQNHRFPGTSSFVVEFPRGPVEGRVLDRLGYAIAQLSREVGED